MTVQSKSRILIWLHTIRLNNINRENGSITLLDPELDGILNIDPISRYFEIHPDKYDEYLMEYGKPYVSKPQTDRITFEWR